MAGRSDPNSKKALINENNEIILKGKPFKLQDVDWSVKQLYLTLIKETRAEVGYQVDPNPGWYTSGESEGELSMSSE